MRRLFKLLLKKIFIIMSKAIGVIFYDSKYLKGKHFTNGNLNGHIWVMRSFIFQKIIGINRDVPWPVAHTILINNWRNIIFHPNDLHIFQTGGTYFQAQDAQLTIGEGTLIAPNVGLITTNHDTYNIDQHAEGKPIILGGKCWIGMNAVILPGVILGPHTVVAAGSVVTKSFPEGFCIIGGTPGKVIKLLDKEECI